MNSNNSRTKFVSSVSDSPIQKNTFRNEAGMRVDETARSFKKEATQPAHERQDQSHGDLVNDHSRVKKRPLFKRQRLNSTSSSKQETVNIGHPMEITTGEKCNIVSAKASGSSTNNRAREPNLSTSGAGSHSREKPPQTIPSSTSASPTNDAFEKCPLCPTVFPKR